MKNQDKHPIDSYFKDNIGQEFPYNPSSWKKAAMVIDSYFGRKRRAILIITFFSIAGCILMFLAFNTENKTTKKPIVNKQTSRQLKNKNSLSFNKPKPKIQNPTVPDIREQNTTSKENLNLKYRIEHLNNNSIKKIQIAMKIGDILDKTYEDENPLNLITENPDTSRTKERSTFFTDLVLYPKLLHSFYFNNSNNSPLPSIAKTERKKKFVFMLELEARVSTGSKHELSGLSKAETEYRKNSEQIKSANSYGINLIFQRRNFGLVTGLAYQNVMIKTNYLVNQITYDTRILYKTDYKTVPSSSGGYLLIHTRSDTLGKRSEVKRIEDQPDQNQFEWFSVPLKISYQYPHNCLRFSIRAGADLSWLYKTKGSFINSDLKGLTLIGKDEQKLKRFNTNISAQFMAGYQLNKMTQIGATLYWSRQLGSDFKDYGSRFQNAGLGLYVRMGLY